MATEVSLAVIQKGKSLLVQRRNRDPYRNYLGLFGGKVEKNESREGALVREVKEECSLDIISANLLGKVTETLYRQYFATQVDLYIYRAIVRGEAISDLSEGESVWVNIVDLNNRKHEFIPTDWIILKKVIEGKFTTLDLSVLEENNKYSIISNHKKNKRRYKSLIIGSFRKHYKEMTKIIQLFNESNIEVLSPKRAKILNPEDEFVIFDYDPKDLTAKELEDLVLQKMHKVDFVYLVNPGGYVGLSAAFEIGYCAAHGIKVFAMESADELCAKYLDAVKTPHEVINHIKYNL